MNLVRPLTVMLMSLCVVACTTQSPNKFSDDSISRIYDLKDRRSTDSLLFFLESPNARYREEAALTFASLQDSTASLKLGTMLLEDPDPIARINAAYSLGQTTGFQATNALIPALMDKDTRVVREALEGLGKTVKGDDIGVLVRYSSSDTLLQEGQAWGIYQLSLRSMADGTATQKASAYLLPPHSFQTRLAAAHFFSRSKRIDGNGFEKNLVQAALNDPRPEVRMAAVSGLRHLERATALPVLKKVYEADTDYRVRISAVRAAREKEILFHALQDSVEMVQVAAAQVLRSIADKELAIGISDALGGVASKRARADLYAALLKSGQPGPAMNEILEQYPSSTRYDKAAFLSAIGESLAPNEKQAFTFLTGEMLNMANEKVVITAAASAIVLLDDHVPGTSMKGDFLHAYQEAIAQGDAAVIGIVCQALMNEKLNYRRQIKDFDFLYKARTKLSMPKDIESLQPLEEAIAFLEGKEKPVPIKNEFNHPIDWNAVKGIPINQKAVIKTNKGVIIIQLLVEETPGSTSNFIELVKKKYFDGKFFHRVVPNFVVQTGCNRGDGYGSEDYSIRSEFSKRRYETGSVGMASAGKDTEGTQWFITHSPTPHLDGKYTIFAEVLRGMGVVDHIEVGDRILEITLENEK